MHFIQLFTNIIFCLFNHFCVFVFGGEKLFLLSFFLFGCFVGILLGLGWGLVRIGDLGSWGIGWLLGACWKRVDVCWALVASGWLVFVVIGWKWVNAEVGWEIGVGKSEKFFLKKWWKIGWFCGGGGWMKEIFAKWKNAKKLSKNCEKSENFVYFLWFLCIFWFSAKVFFHLYLSHKERFLDRAFFLTYFVDLVYNISIENIY